MCFFQMYSSPCSSEFLSPQQSSHQCYDSAGRSTFFGAAKLRVMPVRFLLVVLLIKAQDYILESVNISGHRERPLAHRCIEVSVSQIIVKVRRIDEARLISQ